MGDAFRNAALVYPRSTPGPSGDRMKVGGAANAGTGPRHTGIPGPTHDSWGTPEPGGARCVGRTVRWPRAFPRGPRRRRCGWSGPAGSTHTTTKGQKTFGRVLSRPRPPSGQTSRARTRDGISPSCSAWPGGSEGSGNQARTCLDLPEVPTPVGSPGPTGRGHLRGVRVLVLGEADSDMVGVARGSDGRPGVALRLVRVAEGSAGV